MPFLLFTISMHVCCNIALLWKDLELMLIMNLVSVGVTDLVIERDSSVHMGAFLLIVTCSFHHVLWVTEQSQVHQLVIQTTLLVRHNTYKSTNHWKKV